jgi:hypothetical protein
MKLPTMAIATSVRYGNYKEHLNNALLLSDVLTKSYKTIKQFIKLPQNLFVNFRPVRDAYGRAFFLKPNPHSSAKEYIVELDVRQDVETFKNTLIHELVHIEQFYEGRLKDAGPTHFKWNGKKTFIDTSSLDIYNNLPWEVEANVRAELLSHVVFH